MIVSEFDSSTGLVGALNLPAPVTGEGSNNSVDDVSDVIRALDKSPGHVPQHIKSSMFPNMRADVSIYSISPSQLRDVNTSCSDDAEP